MPGHDFEIGYGKPPRHTQWQKGTSGNPRGRPRKKFVVPERSYNPYRDIVLREMDRLVNIREGADAIEVSAFQAAVRSMLVKAIQGDFRTQRLVAELYREVQEEHIRDLSHQLQWVENYKATWSMNARHAEQVGRPLPLPRPEHIGFSPQRGVELTGPSDHLEQFEWECLKVQLRSLETLLAEALQEADARRVRILKQALRQAQSQVPAGWDWREDVAQPVRTG